mgnify:FL=1
MYCVSVYYPNKEDAKFDLEYYTTKHIPMVAGYIGDNVVKAEVHKGVASGDGSPAKFVYTGSIWINSVERFRATMAEHGGAIMGDIPNYTNIEPILQVDEVLE